MLLNAVLFLPLIGFIIALLLPRQGEEAVKKFALVFSLVIFALSLGLIASVSASPNLYSQVTDVEWIHTPMIRYHVGIGERAA